MLAGAAALFTALAGLITALGVILKVYLDHPRKQQPPAPIVQGMTVDLVDPEVYWVLVAKLADEREQHTVCDGYIVASGLPPLHGN